MRAHFAWLCPDVVAATHRFVERFLNASVIISLAASVYHYFHLSIL
jgi:hypothetical protein